jgi:hypothetical protein
LTVDLSNPVGQPTEIALTFAEIYVLSSYLEYQAQEIPNIPFIRVLQGFSRARKRKLFIFPFLKQAAENSMQLE